MAPWEVIRNSGESDEGLPLLEPGTLIASRYELRSLLGRGGDGLVYRATDQKTDFAVAVKVLSLQFAQDVQARARLELEARVAGRVRSEHLARVLDAGQDDATGLLFLVMELLEGKNLQELVDQEGPLSPELTVEYLRQVASGLDKVHALRDADGQPAPIVHRDLKPSNLMLTHREDGEPLVKILDWGIAKRPSTAAAATTGIKGTPLYMAPEQLVLPVVVTPSTDIWAFGLVAFFSLTGRSFWKSGQQASAEPWSVIVEMREGAVVTPRQRLEALGSSIQLPPAFDDWFGRCLNLEPWKRPQSAGEAVRDLALALEVVLQESRPPRNGARHGSPRHGADHERPSAFPNEAEIHGNAVPQPVARQPRSRRLLWTLLIGGIAAIVWWASQFRSQSEPVALQPLDAAPRTETFAARIAPSATRDAPPSDLPPVSTTELRRTTAPVRVTQATPKGTGRVEVRSSVRATAPSLAEPDSPGSAQPKPTNPILSELVPYHPGEKRRRGGIGGTSAAPN